MKERILVAAVFVPILFVVLFFLPPFVLAVVIVSVCAVSAYELIQAIGVKDNLRVTVYTLISAVVIPAGVYFGFGQLVFTAVFLVLLCLMFFEAIIVFKTDRQISFSKIMTTLFAGALIPYLLSGLVSLKAMEEGHLLVLMPVISAFVTDAGAYFAGVLLGKHKAFPNISPMKTVEGYLGGIIIGMAAMMLYGFILANTTLYDIRFWALAIYGIIGAVFTELGDLAFSLIKREFGFKDYGQFLPGHGGMLDRFDSMIFAAPAIYLLISVIPALVME